MPQTEFIYDDEYDGPRWRYGLTYRPPSGSSLPSGWIIWSDRKSSKFAHGTIEYPRELTPQEIAAYELVDLGKVIDDAEA